MYTLILIRQCPPSLSLFFWTCQCHYVSVLLAIALNLDFSNKVLTSVPIPSFVPKAHSISGRATMDPRILAGHHHTRPLDRWDRWVHLLAHRD
jgi:hypothetical protein